MKGRTHLACGASRALAASVLPLRALHSPILRCARGAHSWPLVCFALSAPFLACPSSFLSGPAAAGGIAIFTTIGTFGGFFGPEHYRRARNRVAAITRLAWRRPVSGSCWPRSSCSRSGARWRRVGYNSLDAGTRRNLRQMRLAAHPVHDGALHGELSRPRQYRFRGAHHEQGPRLHAGDVWLGRGHFLLRLFSFSKCRAT